MQKNSIASEQDGGYQEDENSAQLYRSLVGLVKLQALVRGIRARKRVAKLLAAQRKKNGSDGVLKAKALGITVSKHTASNSVLRSISHKSSE